MANYTKTKVQVHNGLADYIEVDVCGLCGVPVLDQTQHDLHHARLNETARVARDADNTASMLRPLGGAF